jgi:hypothetical protein
MLRRPDYFINDEVEEYGQGERLEALVTFQINSLNHALQCKFPLGETYSICDLATSIMNSLVPRVKRVVYSTCSVNELENERVISRVLSYHPKFRLIPIMENWPRRGLSSADLPNGNRFIDELLPNNLYNGFLTYRRPMYPHGSKI